MHRDSVFVAVPNIAIRPIHMDEHEWLTIQGPKGNKLGGKVLTPAVRKHLLEVTRLYASSLQTSDSVKPLKRVVDRIDGWKRQTASLRKFIWNKGKSPSARSKYLFADWDAKLEKIFLEKPCNNLEIQFPLALLDRVLKGTILVSEIVQEQLQSDTESSEQKKLWFVWAATVFSILGKAGVSVRHPKRKNLLLGPVQLLSKLQAKLPAELHLRRTQDSFRKGAVVAFKIRSGNPTYKLERILRRWSRGDFSRRFGSPENSVLRRFDRLTEPYSKGRKE